MDYLYQWVVGSEKRPGVEQIYLLGEIEQIIQEKRETKGIPIANPR